MTREEILPSGTSECEDHSMSQDPVGRLFSALSVMQVVANKWSLVALQLPRWKGFIELRDGSRLQAEHSRRNQVRKLLTLASHGASFRDAPGSGVANWKVDWNRNIVVTPSGLTFDLDSVNPVVFAETFLYQVHFQHSPLAGRTVVDIGANVGDTALYFAQLGALVYAVEPEPENYDYLLRNISLNPNLAARVIPIKEALSQLRNVPFYAGRGADSSIHGTGKSSTVAGSTLSELIERYSIKEPFLLKVDCKGCEVDLIEDRSIEVFDRVAIEYITRGRRSSPEAICAKLQSHGFTDFRAYKHNTKEFSLAVHGIVEAWKVRSCQHPGRT